MDEQEADAGMRTVDVLRIRFLGAVEDRFKSTEKNQILNGLAVAERAHHGQVRDDGTPYVLHPLRTALFLVEQLGVREVDLICAALLHDAVEDNDSVSLPELEREFGHSVRRIVETLTKPPKAGRTREEVNAPYFGRLLQGDLGTKLIKLADKLDNLRDALNCPDPAKRLRTAEEGQQFYLGLIDTLVDPECRKTVRDAMQCAITELLASVDVL